MLNTLRKIYFVKQHDIEEVLSYLPDVANEYNPDLAGDFGFAKFASQRCVLRFVDEHRRLHKYKSINKRNQISPEDGHDNAALNIIKGDPKTSTIKPNEKSNKSGVKITKMSLNDLQLSENTRDYLHALDNQIMDDFVKDIEWKDLRQTLTDNLDGHFNLNPSGVIYKKLILEYLLPKAEGQDHKTLGQLAHEIGKTEGRLCQMLRDERMKSYICKYFPMD